MNTQSLYELTAKILNVSPDCVQEFCEFGDQQAVKIVTPEELAEQIKEYEGRG
jgi:hypothetical protein